MSTVKLYGKDTSQMVMHKEFNASKENVPRPVEVQNVANAV